MSLEKIENATADLNFDFPLYFCDHLEVQFKEHSRQDFEGWRESAVQ